MDDERIWTFEASLWTGDADTYRELVDDECVMVLPQPPFAMSGAQAIEAVASTPRWDDVNFSEQQVNRPQEGLIVIAYLAEATAKGKPGYKAWCTSTIRRLEHEKWRVVQHQQTPPPVAAE